VETATTPRKITHIPATKGRGKKRKRMKKLDDKCFLISKMFQDIEANKNKGAEALLNLHVDCENWVHSRRSRYRFVSGNHGSIPIVKNLKFVRHASSRPSQ